MPIYANITSRIKLRMDSANKRVTNGQNFLRIRGTHAIYAYINSQIRLRMDSANNKVTNGQNSVRIRGTTEIYADNSLRKTLR